MESRLTLVAFPAHFALGIRRTPSFAHRRTRRCCLLALSRWKVQERVAGESPVCCMNYRVPPPKGQLIPSRLVTSSATIFARQATLFVPHIPSENRRPTGSRFPFLGRCREPRLATHTKESPSRLVRRLLSISSFEPRRPPSRASFRMFRRGTTDAPDPVSRSATRRTGSMCVSFSPPEPFRRPVTGRLGLWAIFRGGEMAQRLSGQSALPNPSSGSRPATSTPLPPRPEIDGLRFISVRRSIERSGWRANVLQPRVSPAGEPEQGKTPGMNQPQAGERPRYAALEFHAAGTLRP